MTELNIVLLWFQEGFKTADKFMGEQMNRQRLSRGLEGSVMILRGGPAVCP